MKSACLRRTAPWLALLVVAAAATACSSADGSSEPPATASGGADSSACTQEATDNVKPYEQLPNALPSDLTPLKSKPAPGGSIIRIVNGSVPTDVNAGKQYAAVAKAIGWTGSYMVQNGSVEDLNAKFEEAIGKHPTVIVADGNPLAAVQQSVNDAKKAGIVVVLGAVLDKPQSFPGFAAGENGGPVYKKMGELQANLFLRDSHCSGGVAIFNLDYPVLDAEADAFQAVVKAKCPKCEMTSNSIPGGDIGAPAGINRIVSVLQSHPNIKYVYSAIAPIAGGLVPALDGAGIQGIKIFGQTPDEQAIAALKQGTNAWWVTQSSDIDPWMTTYAALRAIEAKQPIELTDNPVGILTPDNVPKDATQAPTYPANYDALFRQLVHAD